MKIRIKFILFLILIHTLLIAAAISTLWETDYVRYLVLIEIAIVVSLIWSIRSYLTFTRPIKLIADGVESLKDQDFSTKFVEVGQSDMDQLIQVYNGMIDQLRKERIYQQEQHFFLHRLIQASPNAVIVLDFENRITSLNPAAKALPGLGDASMMQALESLPDRLPRALATLSPDESRIIRLNGIQSYKCQKASFQDRGFPHYFIIIQELTQDLLQSERKAYEKVIRMMSHEVNNTIGGINSLLQSLLSFGNQLQDSDQSNFSNAMNVAIQRNTHLGKFMANFAEVVRIPLPNKQTTDIHELLKRTFSLLQSQLQEKNIHWIWELHEQKLLIQADPYQMEQVLVNVIKNAIEATPEEGHITVQSSLDPKEIIIANTGPGISEADRDKLFTPFFSTKQQGQGIGLTLTREILINHDFRFSLETATDGITRFCIKA